MPHGKREKEKMDKVKQMLYKVLSRSLTVEEFENWLYNDEYINSQVLDNEVVLDLLCLNFRSKHIMYELEKFCFRNFNKEECLIEVVKANCEMILSDETDKNIDAFIHNIGHFYNWNDDYTLIDQVYSFGNKWSLAWDGYYSKSEAKKYVLEFARISIEKLNGNQRLRVFANGIELNSLDYIYLMN